MTASALQKLRTWLNLNEASEELSAALSQPVSKADVLRLAIDGDIQLSLYLPVKVVARCRQIEDDSLDPIEKEKKIEGICDVPMIGRAKMQVEHDYHWLFGRYVPIDGPVGASVEHDGMFCKLPPDRGANGISSRSQSEFPQGSVLCIRRMILEEFIKAHAQEPVAKPPEAVEKPLGERERATLLTIIAALAKAAEIDVAKPSKAAESIERLTTDVGARVSARSIEDHLKRIPDAIERKGKTAT